MYETKHETCHNRFLLCPLLLSTGWLCLGHPHDIQQQPPVLALHAVPHWHQEKTCQLGHSISCIKTVTCSWTFIAAFLLSPLWQKLSQISITLIFILFPQHLQVSVLRCLYMSCDISVPCNSPPSVPSLACKTIASNFKLATFDLSHSFTFT